MKSITILAILVLFSPGIAAQERGGNSDPGDALGRLQQRELTGQVTIFLDSLVLENYHKHLVQNRKEGGIDGYKIRIFSDNGMGAKESQKRVQARFLSLFPEIPTDPRYEGSYYKIYVGNFRTKRDALRAMERISKRFPDAFIVEDQIII
jgi:hypothetical protein